MRTSLLLLLSLVTGCANYTILEHSEQTLPASDKPTLIVEMANGSIQVKSVPGKEIHAKLTKRGVGADKEEAEKEIAAMDFELIPEGDGRIRIKAKRLDGSKYWNHSGAEAELEVPRGTTLELVTSNAPITVDGQVTFVKARTRNGNVKVTGVKCPVDIVTTNASVTADDVKDQVKVDTNNGSISVRGTKLMLQCKTSNGNIKHAGDLLAGNHTLVSSNGNITVTLPKESCMNFEATTSNGRIKNDFSLAKTDKSTKNYLKGVIGKGQADTTLVMKTSNSNVYLKKTDKAIVTASNDGEDD